MPFYVLNMSGSEAAFSFIKVLPKDTCNNNTTSPMHVSNPRHASIESERMTSSCLGANARTTAAAALAAVRLGLLGIERCLEGKRKTSGSGVNQVIGLNMSHTACSLPPPLPFTETEPPRNAAAGTAATSF
jgi:hypothetical protein